MSCFQDLQRCINELNRFLTAGGGTVNNNKLSESIQGELNEIIIKHLLHDDEVQCAGLYLSSQRCQTLTQVSPRILTPHRATDTVVDTTLCTVYSSQTHGYSHFLRNIYSLKKNTPIQKHSDYCKKDTAH
ncbi:hypothetical protein CBL_14209 [Carabus blaptoides fortunei]